MNIKDQNVLVVGMARSGIAAAQLLVKHGARVTVNDSKTREHLKGDLSPLDVLPVRWELGKAASELLDGQDMLVISPGIPDTAPFVLEAQKRHIKIAGELELASQLCPCPMVAVTGTNGKTTTVTLLGEIFTNAGKITHVCGNVGYPFSLAVLHAKKDDMVVVEVSSFQLETVKKFHPHAAALLNITEDHLDRHGTMENYTALKMRIFQNMTNGDVAVFNADDQNLENLAEQTQAQIMKFSRLHPVSQGAWVQDQKIMLRFHGEEKMVADREDLYIPGPHNMENALAAICIAASMHVPLPVIRHTLRTFKGVEHRIEFVRELHEVRYINDSKGTNVNSTIQAIRTMDRPTVILLGGSDKHSSYDEMVMEMNRSGLIQAAVLIGATANAIEEALHKGGFHHIYRAENMKDAVCQMQNIAQPGWNVLLSPACASFDMFSDYEERGQVYKKLVSELI